MTRPSHQVTAAAAAGRDSCCCAGAGPRPRRRGPSSAAASSPARLASRFCADASTFMRNIPAEPKAKRLTPTQARANMSTVLVSTVKGFTALEKEAPAQLRKPLRKIIAVYRGDERVLRTTGDMSKISESMVQGDGSGRWPSSRSSSTSRPPASSRRAVPRLARGPPREPPGPAKLGRLRPGPFRPRRRSPRAFLLRPELGTCGSKWVTWAYVRHDRLRVDNFSDGRFASCDRAVEEGLSS